MEPLPVDKAGFWLALPGSAGGGLVERPGAQIDVRSAVIVSETLPVAGFQAVFDALMGGAIAIMVGEVRVDFGQGASERIPSFMRFNQMNGELFEPAVTPGDQPGHFTVTRNAVESPLRGEQRRCSVAGCSRSNSAPPKPLRARCH